ncbi:MAG: phytanoyl-CoA dioxygenase family protein [Chitinophaga sp.]|uniref:phytanoyl-CoA dioxygenase family protein n=1 Tax=Chitinophaga sp. TaxID=1869181 RepID=UPI0025C0F625|nr:phytanoyl-CoA dioxygenase family protein [Chitinophaga sp.]MBV8252623.1 phytanoyl-CoA dioxygenase family protein [Chitinophaga sp.]
MPNHFDAFTQIMVATHLARKFQQPAPAFENFSHYETRWMSITALGAFETYNFLYAACKDEQHFRDWLLELKGADFLEEAAAKYEAWITGGTEKAQVTAVLLSEEQKAFWQTNGYLRISGLLPDQLCDDVVAVICDTMRIDKQRQETWYPNDPNWHGLMLQVYQHPALAAIRNHPPLKQLFAELYGTHQLIANTDKVSYNPPETDTWKFRHENIHWDIDPLQPLSLYIQGLIYLEDVPESRGPLKVVPGFHHQYEDYIAQFPDFTEAQLAIRQHPGAVKIPGKKGDVLLWQHTLPHCATANRDILPRFVQYISFTKH